MTGYIRQEVQFTFVESQGSANVVVSLVRSIAVSFIHAEAQEKASRRRMQSKGLTKGLPSRLLSGDRVAFSPIPWKLKLLAYGIPQEIKNAIRIPTNVLDTTLPTSEGPTTETSVPDVELDPAPTRKLEKILPTEVTDCITHSRYWHVLLWLEELQSMLVFHLPHVPIYAFCPSSDDSAERTWNAFH
jgi:hypothetical protein